MQITFDPANPQECVIVAQILDGLHAEAEAETLPASGPVDTSAPHLSISVPDTRDPAAAFGAIVPQPAGTSAVTVLPGAQPLLPGVAPLAPPLPGAHEVAAALQSFNAPGAPQVGAPMIAASLPAQIAPAPAAAPSAPATTANLAGAVDLDSTGLPWDGRIHGSTKTKNKDGTWRAKKGLNDAALVKRIEAEIRATMAMPSPQPQPATAAPTAAPAMQPVMSGPASSAAPVQPAATLPPASAPSASGAIGTMPAAPSLAPPSDVPANFDQLMPRVTAAIGKTLPDGALEWALGQHGLQGVVALIQRPDFVPAVWGTLKQAYPALQ